MTTERAACQATTVLVSKGISAQQPRLIGRLVERIAHRRVQESQREAEAECSAHVAEACVLPSIAKSTLWRKP